MIDLPSVLESLSPALDPNEIVSAMLRMPQAASVTEHEFCDGVEGGARVYKRTMQVPAGTLVAGYAHATDCFNVLLKGKAVVWCDGKVMKIKAPYIFQTKAGVQKFGLFLTDSVWVNFHATTKTTIDEVEAETLLPCPALDAHRAAINAMITATNKEIA